MTVPSARATVFLSSLAALVLVAGVAGVTPALAATDHVTTCPPFLPGSLPDVVDNAASGDTIVFDQDCTGGSAILLSGEIVIGTFSAKTLTIDASGRTVTINGNGSRIFHARLGTTLTLKHLTLTNGGAFDSDGGGAIFNDGPGTLTVAGSTISNSIALSGGGAIQNGGTLVVQKTTFNGNRTAGSGGAIRSNGFGTTTISSSTFTGNQAEGGPTSNGGAIMTGTSSPSTIDQSTFTGNTALGDGGAISHTGALTLRNSTLTANTADSGGALDTEGPATLQNDTLSDNTATTAGAQISFSGPVGPETANTIVSRSSGSVDNCSGSLSDQGYDLQFGDTSCGFIDHAVSGDPLLGALASNGGSTQTLALGGGSPAIGAGSATVCQLAVGDRDQRGNMRRSTVRGGCDIGAFDTGASAPSGATTVMSRSVGQIPADGSSHATITVQAKDAFGNRVRVGGAHLDLQTSLGSLSSVTDNLDGTYTVTLTAGTVAGTAKITGTIDTQPITHTVGVTLLAGPLSAAGSTIKSSRQRIPADGSSTTIITVQARDQYSNAVNISGLTVEINSDIGLMGGVTYIGSGRYQATLTSAATPGTATVSGTINGVPMTATASVRFI